MRAYIRRGLGASALLVLLGVVSTFFVSAASQPPGDDSKGESLFPSVGTARSEQHQAEEQLSTNDHYVAFDYSIDRSNVPSLYYNQLTLIIDVGVVDEVQVTAAGEAIPYDYDVVSGQVKVTTDAANLHLVLKNPQGEANLGAFEKAALKDNKKWAWSHGMDDNTFLGPSIEAFAERGWRASLFLIARDIDDTRNEAWIVDAGQIKQLLEAGWSIGNHTWDHSCLAADINQQTILRGYDRLKEIIHSSNVTDYRLAAFAAPCFASEYQPLIQSLIEQGQTDLLYNESGNDYRLVVDAGAGPYTAEGNVATSFTQTMAIGRDPTIESNPARVKQEMDWMAAHASEERHFWYNTLSHGNNEASLETVIDYVYNRYGPAGTNELLVAPSDEIYSYLLVRDHSRVSVRGPLAVTTDSSPIATYALTYTINRETVPDLYYQDLTLLVNVGQAENIQVTADGSVEYNYDSNTGIVKITTAAEQIELLVTTATDVETLGRFSKAVLKDDKAWAWSHSMDDNGNLREAIDVLRQYGWQGTLYLVGDWIVEPTMGGYLLNEDELRQLLAEGWALGNHTQDHQCDPSYIAKQSVIDGYNALRAIADSSTVPDYKIISFAAPCMEWTYNSIIQGLIANGESEVLFNESDKRDTGYQNYYRLVVDPGASYENDWRTTTFATTIPVGRNFDFESNEPGKGSEMVKGDLDEIAGLSQPELHFWYNTASHGYAEEKLQEVASHVYNSYGPGGTNEVWVAPGEEIYSYLRVRDNSVVTFSGPTEVVPGPPTEHPVRLLLPLIQS